MPRNCCKYFTVSLVPVAALTLAILFACAIVALPVLYVELATRTKYGVVIDAGSSHTDLYIYSWRVPRSSSDFTTGRLEEEYHCCSQRFLGNYTTHPEDAGEAFQPCVDDSHREHIIPDSEWDDTKIFLGATAGMRLVRISNETVSDAIMKQAREALHGSKYSFGSAEILEEKVEAMSGWVTTNYASASKHRHFPSEEDTIGSLDLGGASVEIAFIAPSNDNYSEEYRATEEIFGVNYTVYARSYLCYGHNEAQRRFLAHLVDTQHTGSNHTGSNHTVYKNPCYLDGSNLTFDHDDIFNSPCVDGVTAMEVFGYMISSPLTSTTDKNFTFVGTSDVAECNATIQHVFNFTACNISTTCIDDRYFLPPVTGSGAFMGFSGFEYVASSYNQSGKTLDATGLDRFKNNVTMFCKTNYSGSGNVSKCFNGAYVLHLLQNGFGFTHSHSGWTVKFVDKVDDITVGWAMGFLMNETTTTIPIYPYYTERPYTTVDLVVGVIVLSILCLVFVVFFFLTFYACRKVIKTRSGYTDIA